MTDDIAILDFLAERQRPAKPPPLAEVSRELTVGELERLREPAAMVPVKVMPLDRVGEIHHVQARLLAEGKTPKQVAAIVGTSATRVKLLVEDPTFQDLVGYYRDQVTIKYLDVHERASLVLSTALTETLKRLEENPDGFTNAELRRIVEIYGDRTVLPNKAGVQAPVAGLAVVTLNFDPPKGHQAPTIDLEPSFTEPVLDLAKNAPQN